jgi:hypothetical protein
MKPAILKKMQPRLYSIIILAVTGLSGAAFAGQNRPIVDIRFKADYGQVTNSHGDEWAPAWADDGNLYTGNDDGTSFGGIQERSLAFGKLSGNDPNALVGTTVSDMGGYGKDVPRPDGANWKTMNSYCVNGVLYMFVTRCLYPDQAKDPHHRHVFKNSSIIKSTDHGVTWTKSADENYARPMFDGLRFGAPYFVWYGQDGAASVDNAGKYIYAVANNGHFEDGDDYVLGRVANGKLAKLNGADWQFFTGGDGMFSRNWSHDMTRAKAILADPLNCSMTGMTFIPDLGRYVMVVWHYVSHDISKDPRTVNDYYEAPKPWGPWTKFKTVQTGLLGWYVPIIGQKFQKRIDSQTVDCFLYPTGYYLNWNLYKFDYIPITLSTAQLDSASKASR